MCRLLQYASASAALVALLLAATDHGVARPRNQFAARSLTPAAMSTPGPEPLKFADTALEPIDWNALYGWAIDDHAAAFATFQSSCRPLLRTIPPKSEMRPMYFALTHICR
jgi:membrane-bound lytic murein transglycosylase A